MRTIEHKNIPYGGGGQVLIQVQLIYSLPFVTTLENNNNKKWNMTEFLTQSALWASCIIKMTSAQVVETSVNVNSNSHS